MERSSGCDASCSHQTQIQEELLRKLTYRSTYPRELPRTLRMEGELGISASFPKLLPHLLPLLNLALVFLQQTSAGCFSALASLLHVLSNPVDALYNILFRQEVVRRCHTFASSHTPDVTREFTAVLSAFDQWLQDARQHVLRTLTFRQRMFHHSNIGITPGITEQEKQLIRVAATRLRCCRDDGSIKAKVSILSYLFTLTVVVFKVYLSKDEGTQQGVGQVLSVITLFDHLTFAVYLNGCVGSYLHQEEASRIVFELVSSLTDACRTGDHAMSLLPHPSPGATKEMSLPVSNTVSAFYRQVAELGSASGQINCLRPANFDTLSTTEGRGKPTLFAISVCAIVTSSVGAIAIPLTTSHSVTREATLPTACCVSVWAFNGLISLGIAVLQSRNLITVRTYSIIIASCDVLFGELVIGCSIWSVNAWRSVEHESELTVSTTIAWVIIVLVGLAIKRLLVFWADYDGDHARLVFVRSKDEVLADFEGSSSGIQRRTSF